MKKIKQATALAAAAALSATMLAGCGGSTESLSLIHISEPTRPY